MSVTLVGQEGSEGHVNRPGRLSRDAYARGIHILEDLKLTLDVNINHLKRQGTIAIIVTSVLGLALYADIKFSMLDQINRIDQAKNPNQVLAYLAFRSAALGAIATTASMPASASPSRASIRRCASQSGNWVPSFSSICMSSTTNS